MMTDREYLEKAAKAAGLRITGWPQPDYCTVLDGDREVGWQPLVFDSDALRLAVKLGLQIDVYGGSHAHVAVGYGKAQTHSLQRMHECVEEGSDLHAATRRAIVRAAAAMADQS